MELYDTLGHGYRQLRQQDPRIAARILRALGDATSVINVGAGLITHCFAADGTITSNNEHLVGHAAILSMLSRFRTARPDDRAVLTSDIEWHHDWFRFTAIYLAKYADRVTLLVRGPSLATSMSDYLIKQITATSKIEVSLNTQIVGGYGTRRLEQLVLQSTPSGETRTVPAAALFIYIGVQPHTNWLPPTILRDKQGFILTGTDLEGRLPETWQLARAPLPLETSLPGVFAVGDVRHRSVKRVASAVGEGSIAIPYIHKYLGQA